MYLIKMSPKFLRLYETALAFLQKEINSVNENLKLIYEFKEDVISNLETKKLRLRQQTDANKIHNGGKTKTLFISNIVKEKFLTLLDSVQKMLDEIKVQNQLTRKKLSIAPPSQMSIPREVSLIQNQYDLIYTDMKELKTYLEERIRIVHKTEFIMNVLNYKQYEVAYNFRQKIEHLNEVKMGLGAGEVDEHHLAFQTVEVEKQITECENTHEAQMQCIKEQKLEAQEEYEDAVYVLDTNLETMRKQYNVLLQLVEAEKVQLTDSQIRIVDDRYSEMLEALQEDIDKYTEMQTIGWKSKIADKLSVLLEERGLKFTTSGLLITMTGERITYQEAREKKLLGDIDFPLDFFQDDLEESETSSEFTKMTSEDVEYLKKYLGIPLTLALAEITAVQPRDPIHYLGHWLFKYRYNQEMTEIQKIEMEQLEDERNRLARERWHKFIEEEARAAVLEMIFRAEEEAMKNELLRIQRELEAMEDEEYEENLEDEARDKFESYDSP